MKLRSTEILSVAGLAHGPIAKHKPFAAQRRGIDLEPQLEKGEFVIAASDGRIKFAKEERQIAGEPLAELRVMAARLGWLAFRTTKLKNKIQHCDIYHFICASEGLTGLKVRRESFEWVGPADQ